MSILTPRFPKMINCSGVLVAKELKNAWKSGRHACDLQIMVSREVVFKLSNFK